MDERDFITDDEVLYRRIPQSQVSFDSIPRPSKESCRPGDADVLGLSVFRAAFVRPEELGSLVKPKAYYVAVLSVRKLRELGIAVRPDALCSGLPGHAILPGLTAEGRGTNEQHVLAARLAAEVVEAPLLGPFEPKGTREVILGVPPATQPENR
ncbi:MAG: hypothetical protein JNJ88_16035 [Planctomycetes bacterium]|nr:hypothetical protein [Planctomycetota bacterium]